MACTERTQDERWGKKLDSCTGGSGSCRGKLEDIGRV